MTQDQVKVQIEEKLEQALTGQPIELLEDGQMYDVLWKTIKKVIGNLDVEDIPIEIREQIFQAVERVFDAYVRPMALPKFLDDWIWNRLSIQLHDALKIG